LAKSIQGTYDLILAPSINAPILFLAGYTERKIGMR